MPVPRIHDSYLDCVIYLYPSEIAAEEGTDIGGSGFLVSVPTEGLQQNFFFVYAVTNTHVIEAGNCVIRMNTMDGKKDILQTDERDWVFYEGGDDLAVCLISFDPRQYKFQHIIHQSVTLKTLTAAKIGPGDDVFVVGRFINHEGKQRKSPNRSPADASHRAHDILDDDYMAVDLGNKRLLVAE